MKKPIPTKHRKRVYATQRFDRDKKVASVESRFVKHATKNKLFWMPAKTVQTDFGSKTVWKAVLQNGEYYRIIRGNPRAVYYEINPPRFTLVKASLVNYSVPKIGSSRVTKEPRAVEQIIKTFHDLETALYFALEHSGLEQSNTSDILYAAVVAHVDELPTRPIPAPILPLETLPTPKAAPSPEIELDAGEVILARSKKKKKKKGRGSKPTPDNEARKRSRPIHKRGKKNEGQKGRSSRNVPRSGLRKSRKLERR